MAYVEDPVKRAAVDKRVRIDHSDVYLQNEKLADSLLSDLDRLARRRHRQILNRDNEIRLLRKALSTMTVTKTSLHPPTPATATATTTTTTSFRRLKPQPAVVKLDVHVPHPSQGHASDRDGDSDEDSSDDDTTRRTTWRKVSPGNKTVIKMAWEEPAHKDAGEDPTGSKGGGGVKPEVKRITREQHLLHNLDMSSIPTAWFTQVHQPSDVIPRRRRASSAHPSQRPTLPTPSTTTTAAAQTRRPQSETAIRPRPRRTKSAVPPTANAIGIISIQDEDLPSDTSSTLFCAGPQKKTLPESTLRSRRQLMAEMGVGKGGGADSSSGGDASDSNRLKFLTALRRERERLDGRVKMFLQSCDGVREGGISSRKAREFQSFFLPPPPRTVASEIKI